jgi:hypothetical protein
MARKTKRQRKQKNQRGGKPLEPGEIPVGKVSAAKKALNGSDPLLDKLYEDAYYFAYNKFAKKETDIALIINEIMTTYKKDSYYEIDAITQGVNLAKLTYDGIKDKTP